MSTPVAGSLATVPLFVAAGDIAVWWNDPVGTWESVPLGSGSANITGAVAGQLTIAGSATSITSSIPTTNFATPTDVSTGDNLRVLKAGDTMTGRLVVNMTGEAFRVTGADASLIAVLTGTTRAVRFGADASSAKLEGVDQTGVGSYQPLSLGGSLLSLDVAGVEKARLDANGNFLIGNTTSSRMLGVKATPAIPNDFVAEFTNTHATAGDGVIFLGGGPNASDTTTMLAAFYDSSITTLQGKISRNGSGAVAYITTSDARLKEDLSASETGLDVLMQIKVYDFRMIGDDRVQQGFVAQELVDLYPVAVSVGGDDPAKEPWGAEYGRLTPLLVRAVQQQQERIADLETRLSVLEAARA